MLLLPIIPANRSANRFAGHRLAQRCALVKQAKLREGQPFSFTLAGDLTVRDVTRPVSWAVEALLEGNALSGRATTGVKMSDFGIQPPNLRILRAEDEVALELAFVARAVAAGAQ